MLQLNANEAKSLVLLGFCCLSGTWALQTDGQVPAVVQTQHRINVFLVEVMNFYDCANQCTRATSSTFGLHHRGRSSRKQDEELIRELNVFIQSPHVTRLLGNSLEVCVCLCVSVCEGVTWPSSLALGACTAKAIIRDCDSSWCEH